VALEEEVDQAHKAKMVTIKQIMAMLDSIEMDQ
jgi:hypothetical protein